MTNPDEHDIDPDNEDNYCGACAGTGEGQYDGAVCCVCHGKGYRAAHPDAEDFNEPEDDFEPWDGPN